MDFTDTLNNIYQEIASQSDVLDEKITRLEQAKKDITEEQAISSQEISKMSNPDLGVSWTGSRAHSFHDSRTEAYDEMVEVVNTKYDDYIQKIQERITALEIERSFWDVTSSLAYEASQLLDKGEDAFEELGSKLDDLKRRLF
jgi:Domain of unknown function (DUF5082)